MIGRQKQGSLGGAGPTPLLQMVRALARPGEARHDIIKGQVVKDGHFLFLGEFKDGQSSV